MSTTLYREFTVESGRYLPHLMSGHPCTHMHGHSFVIRVRVTGTPDAETGLLMDFAELDASIMDVRRELDHKVLNEIAGLENPTTELLARWIWNRLASNLSGLSSVIIKENPYTGCIYTGE